MWDNLFISTTLNTVTKGQWFVLKALRPEFRNDLVRRELLTREFKLGRQMNHPNIVRFLSLENDKVAGDCIVMEYVDGFTLADFLGTKPSLAVRKRLARQLLEAMRSRHADAEEMLQARFRAGEFDGRPCPDAPTVTDIDGNTYTTVQIGCQCWMRENYRYVDHDMPIFGIYHGNLKRTGRSVRCVKNR